MSRNASGWSEAISVKAFSLLEMSVVIGIIGVIVAGGLVIGQSQIDSIKKLSNQEKIRAIETALMSYRLAYDRLPCPAGLTLANNAPNFGVEAFRGAAGGADEGKCSTKTTNLTGASVHSDFGPSGNIVAGGIPTKALGISDEMAFDAFDRRFTYYVDARLTADNAFNTYPVDGNTNEAVGDEVGEIIIKDSGGNNRTDKAVYAIVSHGENGHGGFTRAGNMFDADSVNTHEQENCNCDANATSGTFNAQLVQKVFDKDPANALNNFDDIVVFKNRFNFYSDKDDVPVTIDSDGPVVDVANCPAGFVALVSGSVDEKTLGCMQVELANSGNKLGCREASEWCYDNYGGRLPSYGEFITAEDNALIKNLGNGNNYEFTKDSSYGSCTSIGYNTAPADLSYTTPYYFRCFIPNQPTIELVPATNAGIYKDFPDSVQCTDGADAGNFVFGSVNSSIVTYFYSDESQYVRFNVADGSYNGHSGALAAHCSGLSISDINTNGNAFWFVNQRNSCPAGFTTLERNNQLLGCIQNAVQGSASCSGAISNCWSGYGARLPNYSEILAGTTTDTVTISSEEWLDGASASGSCTTYKSGSLGSDTSSSSNDYRCFIPLANYMPAEKPSVPINCPPGFVSLEQIVSGGVVKRLGCIQRDLANGAAGVTCKEAHSYCFANFGARLPSYNESYAAHINNRTVNTGAAGNEWLDGATNGSYCETITSSYLPGSGLQTSSNGFRCFLPNQPFVQEVEKTSAKILGDWPDAVVCENARGADDHYYYLRFNESESSKLIKYGSGSGEVNFNAETGLQTSGLNVGNCSGQSITQLLEAGKGMYLLSNKKECPGGFESLYDKNNSIGCVQKFSNTAATCQEAAKKCWENYNARVASFDEVVIGIHKEHYTLSANEWVRGVSGAGKCPVITSSGEPDEDVASNTNEFRCFASPRQLMFDTINDYTYGASSMLGGSWPDALMCKNYTSSEMRYYYLSTQNERSDRVYYHHAASGTDVAFEYVDETYVSGPAGFDCASNRWNLADFVTEERAYNFFAGVAGTKLQCVGYDSYLGNTSVSGSKIAVDVTGSAKNGVIDFFIGDHEYYGSPASCYISDSRDLYCWGDNSYGQVGDGTRASKRWPVLVSGGHKWNSVHTSEESVCGVTTSGDGYCWGRSYSGQLGNGTTAIKSTPTLVSGGHKWSMIKSGMVHSCGLTTAGVAYCWGRNDGGQLGNGSTTSSLTPTAVTFPAGVTSWKFIDAGGDSAQFRNGLTCAIANTDDAYCWGDTDRARSGYCGGSDYSPIGNGVNSNGADFTTPTLVSGGHKWSMIDIASMHDEGVAVYGITTSGDGYSWGCDYFGALGDDFAIAGKNAPVQIHGGHKWLSIHGGGYGTCGTTTDNIAYCWGWNSRYNVGVGNSTPYHIPITAGVFSPGAVQKVKKSFFIACAIVEQ